MRIFNTQTFLRALSSLIRSKHRTQPVLSLPSVTHTQEERELSSFPGISERSVWRMAGWNPTQPAPRDLCPSLCDTLGATPGSQRGWGVSFRSTLFSHDPERFALFAASLLCGAQVSGWGPFISGTDVLHRRGPWGQNRPLHSLRNLAHTSRPASHSLTQMPSRVRSPGRRPQPGATLPRPAGTARLSSPRNQRPSQVRPCALLPRCPQSFH